MTPEPKPMKLEVWILAELTVNPQWHPGYPGNPYQITSNFESYMSLQAAQQQQTFEVLKNGRRYEIFHLEFPQ